MKAYNLLFDVGNTRAKIALYDERGIVGSVWKTENPLIGDIRAFVKGKNIKQAAISQVGRFPDRIKRFLKKEYGLVQLTEKTKVPIKNSYKTPRTLGKDRLAAVIGAFYMFPKKPCLVIDAGTCITYDFLSKAGTYLGGGISPGMMLRFKAMNDYTAALPLAPFNKSAKYIGKNTKESLQSGAQWGFLLEIEGFINKYREQYPGLQVIITGGDAEYLSKNLKTKIFVNPNLVLDGLNKILNR